MAEPGEYPIHVGSGLDHRADVRVQDGGDAARGGGGRDPVQIGKQGVPLAVIELWPGVVAVGSSRRGQHQDSRPGGDQGVQCRAHVGHRVVAGVVQQHWCEGAGAAQSVFAKQHRERVRAGGQKAFGAKLGGTQTGVAHLGEHPLGRELVSPAGHFAYAP